MKHQNAANELIRRILNTKKGMNGYREEKLNMVNTFMATLRLSGYDEENCPGSASSTKTKPQAPALNKHEAPALNKPIYVNSKPQKLTRE